MIQLGRRKRHVARDRATYLELQPARPCPLGHLLAVLGRAHPKARVRSPRGSLPMPASPRGRCRNDPRRRTRLAVPKGRGRNTGPADVAPRRRFLDQSCPANLQRRSSEGATAVAYLRSLLVSPGAQRCDRAVVGGERRVDGKLLVLGKEQSDSLTSSAVTRRTSRSYSERLSRSAPRWSDVGRSSPRAPRRFAGRASWSRRTLLAHARR